MASPLNLGQIADTTNVAIQKMFKKDAETKSEYASYYNVRETMDYIDKDSSLSGLSEGTFTSENAQITEDSYVQGFDQTYTQDSVDILVPFTYRAWKFGIKKRKLANIATEINRALNRKKNKLAAERLTNGFATSYTHTQSNGPSRTITITGGDALEPFHTSHTREDGGTGMNNVVYDGTTYSLPFDYAGYKAAMRTAGLMVDPRGNPMIPNLDTLVCKKNSSVAFKAKEILGAIKKGQIPESFDNDAAGTPAFKVIELEYLTQDAYWFMFDSSMKGDDYGFQHIESEANNLDPVNIVAKTREMQFAGHTLFQQGHNDVARMWVASAGDSSTS